MSFRAHAGAAGMTGEAVSTGSLWTGGVGAQGFELHGSFDWSTLSAVGTTGMDYCGTPSVAGVATRRRAAPTTTATPRTSGGTAPTTTTRGAAGCAAHGADARSRRGAGTWVKLVCFCVRYAAGGRARRRSENDQPVERSSTT